MRTVEKNGSRSLQDLTARKATQSLLEKILIDEDSNDSIRMCIGMSKLLQSDSVDEFSLARLTGSKHSVDLDFLRLGDVKDLLFHNDIRRTLFLLMANLFNRADEIGERATKDSDSNNPVEIDKLEIGKYRNDSGEERSITSSGGYRAIQELAMNQGIETEDWDALFSTIVKSQLESIEKLKIRQQYSVTESIDYKKNTIGNYAKLLGSIIYGKNERKRGQFTEAMMNRQAGDDLFDVSQDIDSQLNPFVAMLEENQLLSEFKQFSSLEVFGPFKSFVRLMLARPNKFALFGSTNIFALFITSQHPELQQRIEEVRAGYTSTKTFIFDY